MAVAPVVEEIIGYVIIEGGKYLLKKVVGEAGNFIWQLFTDEDGDYIPDDPENPWDTWEDEPDEWFPLPELPDIPITSEPTNELENIIIIAPDGPIILYANPDSENYNAVVSQANDEWLAMYGATIKPFDGYSVSEALLFIIAGCALFWLFGKIFKRRKL